MGVLQSPVPVVIEWRGIGLGGGDDPEVETSKTLEGETRMNIGEVSHRSGLPAKTIRYYEEIGLIKIPRDPNGYRRFSEGELEHLSFLARARSLGFSIEDCRALLGLYRNADRASVEVKHIATRHLAAIETKIRDLSTMRAELSELVDSCVGDHSPRCAILDGLSNS